MRKPSLIDMRPSSNYDKSSILPQLKCGSEFAFRRLNGPNDHRSWETRYEHHRTQTPRPVPTMPNPWKQRVMLRMVAVLLPTSLFFIYRHFQGPSALIETVPNRPMLKSEGKSFTTRIRASVSRRPLVGACNCGRARRQTIIAASA